MLTAFESNYNIATEFNYASEKLKDLPQAKKVEIIRIIQESLSNTARHSGATQVVLKIIDSPEGIRITFSDNGTGFDIEDMKENGDKTKHYGLQNIKERVNNFGDAIITSLTQNNNDFEFSVATNKEESLEVIKSNSEISTVIMDLNLNGINGLDVADELRKIKPNLNVLVYSMYNDPIHVEQALSNDIQGYISKDATIDELRQAIISVAAGSMYFNTQAKSIMKIMLSKNSEINESSSKTTDQIYISYSELTQKEKDVFYYLAQKKDPPEIAKILGKSKKTVINQKSIIYSKMNIRDRLDLLEKARGRWDVSHRSIEVHCNPL